MKTIEKYYKGSNDFVDAYEQKDLEKLKPIFHEGETRWYQEWVSQGKKDEGSCCGGKGLEIWYVAPRCRSAKPINVVNCNWVQGNVSAQKTYRNALSYLAENKLQASYNDGWMD